MINTKYWILGTVRENILYTYKRIWVTDLLFWNHVFTCVSVKFSLAANSCLSCTLRYFCFSNDFSKFCNCESEKAVLALRGFRGKELYCKRKGLKFPSSSSSSLSSRLGSFVKSWGWSSSSSLSSVISFTCLLCTVLGPRVYEIC